MTSYLSENEAKIYKIEMSILLKFLTLKWDISRTIWRIEVSDGSFFFSFLTLFHLSVIFFQPEFPFDTTNISPNSAYIPSTDSFDEILKSHCKFIESVGLEMSEEDRNFSCLYWTPKLHKVLFKHCFIAGSSECTRKICHTCSSKC